MIDPQQQAKIDAIASKYNYKPAAQQQAATNDWFAATAPKAPEKPQDNVFLETGKNYMNQMDSARQNIGSAVTGAADDMSSNDPNKFTKGAIEAPLRTATGGVQAIFAPFTAAAETLIHHMPEQPSDIYGTGGKSIIGDALKSPQVQEAKQKISDWAKQNPDLSRDIVDAITVGTAALGGGEGKSLLNKPVSEIASSVKGGVVDTVTGAKNAVTSTAQGVKNTVVSGANKVASKAENLIAEPRKLSVENVLKETPTDKFDTFAAIAKKATENNKNMTPLEYVGTRAQDALGQIQRKLSTIGRNKNAVINSSAGRTPVGNIVVRFRQDLSNALKSKTSVEGDSRLLRIIDSEATKLGANPSASQVDKFIDFVQDSVYAARRDLTVPTTDAVTAMVKNTTGKLNESLKEKLPESYRTLNQQFHDLVDTRDELNIKLGPQGEKGGALMKRVFSPSDANTKNLFADILKETGIDLTNEATLAKYVMETLGDARQMSMLEQLGITTQKPTPSGLIMTGVNKVLDMANSPEAQLGRARAQTLGFKGSETQTAKAIQPTAQSAAKSQLPVNNKNINTKPDINNSIPENTGDVKGDITNNPEAGFAKVPGLGSGPDPIKIAKKIGGADIKNIQDFMEKPDSLTAYMKLQPLLESEKLTDMPIGKLHDFFQNVIDQRNSATGGLIEGKTTPLHKK